MNGKSKSPHSPKEHKKLPKKLKKALEKFELPNWDENEILANRDGYINAILSSFKLPGLRVLTANNDPLFAYDNFAIRISSLNEHAKTTRVIDELKDHFVQPVCTINIETKLIEVLPLVLSGNLEQNYCSLTHISKQTEEKIIESLLNQTKKEILANAESTAENLTEVLNSLDAALNEVVDNNVDNIEDIIKNAELTLENVEKTLEKEDNIFENLNQKQFQKEIEEIIVPLVQYKTFLTDERNIRNNTYSFEERINKSLQIINFLNNLFNHGYGYFDSKPSNFLKVNTDIKVSDCKTIVFINNIIEDIKNKKNENEIKNSILNFTKKTMTTPAYCPPELANGIEYSQYKEQFENETDYEKVRANFDKIMVYQAGITVYQIVTGISDTLLSLLITRNRDLNFDLPVFDSEQGQGLSNLIKNMTELDASHRITLAQAAVGISKIPVPASNSLAKSGFFASPRPARKSEYSLSFDLGYHRRSPSPERKDKLENTATILSI